MEVDRTKDCFSCRMISGSVLIGAGTYIGLNSRKEISNKWGRLFMQATCIGMYILVYKNCQFLEVNII